MQTSIKIKKFWYADPASDGGLGTNWKEAHLGQRESTVQFQGSDADTTNYKNVVGNILDSVTSKGDKTMNFQLADLTPEVVAAFAGGEVTEDTESIKYDAPENENAAIEKSIMFLTTSNVLFILPRCKFDGYPVVNDDDLHYYQMNSVLLLPEKTGVRILTYHLLKNVAANDILTFVLAAQTGAATIDTGAHTVAIEVANGTDVTTLVPAITTSLGSSLGDGSTYPVSGDTIDFTNAVEFEVESADGTKQVWTVTVTEAA